MIVSEPSNPWVSGVSSLFTVEFYGMIQKHMNPDGVLVQWMHLYEFNDALLLSILKAIASVFPHFEIYRFDDRIPDIAILIRKESGLFPGLGRMEKDSLIRKDFAALKMAYDHFSTRQFVASEATLEPLFGPFNPNSDFFPIVDNNSERSFFIKEKATFLKSISGWPMSYAQQAEGEKYRGAWEKMRRDAYGKTKPPSWKVNLLRAALAAHVPPNVLRNMLFEDFPLEIWPEADRESGILGEVCSRFQDSAAPFPDRYLIPLFYYQAREDTLNALLAVRRLVQADNQGSLDIEMIKQMFLASLWGKNDSLAAVIYHKYFPAIARSDAVQERLARTMLQLRKPESRK